MVNSLENQSLKKSTRITLEDEYGKCTVKVPATDLSMGNIVNDLIVPLLLAKGYERESIKEWMDVQ